ncbi:hypothetical protein [Thermofilum pendens]|uniref:Uncharacterized protein n=1 Tax=Thermofilum pendens (strain DSM 2475 / Hrk 5) TaxID=368408 RepID=A1RXK5_THEPD|nr:hypothetical protein [Thermofilum pendens]ABL77935.1 hypothetical protein Tpen_0529 [Thermofilum pendens Hrk 5]
MYSGEVKRRRIIRSLERFAKEAGMSAFEKAEPPFDASAVDGSGVRVAFKIVSGAPGAEGSGATGSMFQRVKSAGATCADASYGKVYIVVDEEGWVKLTGYSLRREFEDEYKAGLLLVTEEGGVVEIIPAPLRTPSYKHPAALGGYSSESRAQQLPPPLGYSPTRDLSVGAEQARETRAVSVPGGEATGVSTGDLPSFARDNPWLRILSSGGAGRAEEKVPERGDESELPSFARDNPWLDFLSRRRGGSG